MAGSVWSSAALATEHAGAQFDDSGDINKISEWMGKDVQDNEGNEVGEIADFAVNLEDCSIVYAVVDSSGMFNGQAIAVSLSALTAGRLRRGRRHERRREHRRRLVPVRNPV